MTTTRTQQTRHFTSHSSTRKGRTMTRSLTASLLALGIAASTVAGSVPALAASHAAAPARETERSQAGMISSITGFGYAVVSGRHARVDRYATRVMLRSAPAGHVLNLVGGPQTRTSSFTFRVTRFTGSIGAATLQLKQGASSRVERTQWTYTHAGWKLSALGLTGSIPAGLELAHDAPVNGKVSAQMIGKSFQPNEQVTVTYRVTVPNVSSRELKATATPDRFGAFYLNLSFNLGDPSYGYSISATAVGEQGDRATLSTWASGQTR
jgi:hypothetical protein